MQLLALVVWVAAQPNDPNATLLQASQSPLSVSLPEARHQLWRKLGDGGVARRLQRTRPNARSASGLQSSSGSWGSGGTGALVHVCVHVCSGNVEHTPQKPIPVGLPLGRWRHVPTTGGPGCPMSVHSDRRVFFSSVSALYSQALARVYCQCSCEWTTRTRRRGGSASGTSRPVTTPRHLKFPYAGRPRKGPVRCQWARRRRRYAIFYSKELEKGALSSRESALAENQNHSGSPHYSTPPPPSPLI